ncbi:MAG: tetratricopeptide repeat protein, partial [Myxococcota bacterium]
MLLITAVLGCVTAQKAEEDEGPRVLDLRIEEMAELWSRMDAARAAGEPQVLVAELEADLEGAGGRDPWKTMLVAHALLPVDPDEAWGRFRELTVSPGSCPPAEHWAWLGMAKIALGWDLHDQAAALIQQALENAPSSPPALALSGLLALARGEEEEGARLLREVFSQDEAYLSSPGAAVTLSKLELEAGRVDQARSHLEGVIERFPLRVEALEMLAGCAELEEKPAEAAGHLRTALEAAPARADIAARLASLEQAAGNDRGALEAWSLYSQLRPDEIEAWRSQVVLAAGL